jgi:outer membrane protein OmpA-like peptidoglycan-associated protein
MLTLPLSFSIAENHAEEVQSKLKAVVTYLKQNPGKKIEIRGHHYSGTREQNLEDGDTLANLTKILLLEAGASKEQITAISYGAEMPREQVGKSARVEFVFLDEGSHSYSD